MAQGIQARRLLVEGLAIVLSILVAFGIDAAWDLRQDRLQEVEILEGLEREFEELISVLEESVPLGVTGHDNLRRFLRGPASEMARIPADQAWDVVVSPLMRDWVTDLPTGFLDSTVSSGRLATLRDPELLAELARFRSLREDAARTLETVDIFSRQALSVLGGEPAFRLSISGAGARQRLDSDAILALASNEELLRIGTAKVPYWGGYLAILDQTKESALSVLALLEANLG
jgi:hypothetical protein